MHQNLSLDTDWDEEDFEWYSSVFLDGKVIKCASCSGYFYKNGSSKREMPYCSVDCRADFLRRLGVLKEGQGLEATLQEMLKFSGR